MKLLASTLLFIPFTILATPIGDAYKKLNEKTEYCMSQSHNPVLGIKDSWLLSLDDTSQKVALLLLKDSLMERCVETETKDYLYLIYQEYVARGDSTQIDAWLAFKKNGLIDEYKHIVTKGFAEQVSRLSASPEFEVPFDVMATYSHLKGETQNDF
ncbi:hypothetical protein ACPV5O_11500 [Vibrio maritimus]|uniref:hypothetical protein n=1 Tax=Vibrio maritimus TaxID=990268 RepID=UPI0040679FC5